MVWRAHYQPFGKATVNEDPDGDGERITFNLRFPGQYYDRESGLHYNYYRYYDPETGRYITNDPIGINYDFSDPQLQMVMQQGILLNSRSDSENSNLNHLYGYAGQNPVMNIDPFGLVCYVQESTGTKVCDTWVDHGYDKNWNNSDNSAFSDSTNNQCVQDCINKKIKQCITYPYSKKDIRTAAAQTTVCSIVTVVQCTANAANCNEDDDCE